MKSAEALISAVLGVAPEAVHDDLRYQGIPEWDSMNHVNIMLALEALLDVEIDADRMIELTSVAAIKEFIASRSREAGPI